MSDEIVTSTGQWSLVVLRTTQSSVKIWAGTLFSTLKMPDHARIELISPDNTVIHEIIKADWIRPFSKIRKRFYITTSFADLQPGQHYEVRFSRRIEAISGVREASWQTLRTAQFDTLPAQLPTTGQKPFTVGFGSCFYNHRDGGQAAGSYKALYDRGDASVKPDITFLTGDQVYLDIGFDSLSFVSSEIRQRVADDYALHWQALGSILNRGATWMLPDDHEYWNDYPFHDSLIPTLLALKISKVRETWTKAAIDGVQRVQQSPQLDFFELGAELSFCLADLRSYRSDDAFLPSADFNRLTDWARSLTCPGVLVIPQPLIVEENKTERNLLSFKTQYQQLIAALGESGHDIVLLSGDVHFGRIATVSLGPKGGRLVEIIASPLSNLTGLNGIATATPSFKPKKFPDPNLFSIPGWQAKPVQYDKSFAVSTKEGRLFSAYPKSRTREHFMTASFSQTDNGEVMLKVNAWRVRERDGNNLPKRDFEEYSLQLK
ncbi:hypothetical protein [Amphritea sp.]|uniref:hypothetical protein n=1 Tax=Amphritea sp. TaxID=1872502 RepID=UPI003D0FA4A0